MAFYSKFKPEELTIKEFEHWVIVLRQKQQTLGDAVIILKNEHKFVGESTGEEFSEFPKVISWYENKCREIFNAEKFNYNAAMMKDLFVHFHAFPRYSSERDFAGIKWLDKDWPRPISSPDFVELSDELTSALLEAFKD